MPAQSTLAIADAWQRDFPLSARPFRDIAGRHGLSETAVIGHFRELAGSGILARIGAAVRPNAVGASTLAAIAAPPDEVEQIAKIVSAEPAVNHNYERTHAFNIWFVVAAPERGELAATLRRIRRSSGLDVLELPLERAYHIDLGFPLDGSGAPRRPAPPRQPVAPDAGDRALLGAIQDGLPLVVRPYQAIATRLGWSEAQVLARLRHLIEGGVISRFGCILHHRRLGLRANAMVVWDVPDDRVDDLAGRLARRAGITLCYRRSRRLPAWPYNLFAMVHGRERHQVLTTIAAAEIAAGLYRYDSAVLFSQRCFKQRGARFALPERGAA